MSHKLTVNFLSVEYVEELKQKLGIEFKTKKEKVQKVLDGVQMYDLPTYEIDPEMIFTKGIIYYDDVDMFRGVFSKEITEKTTYVYYPEPRKVKYRKKCYDSEELWLNKYPIYIVSKGRWETRYTSKCLEKFGLDYNIIIEEKVRKR